MTRVLVASLFFVLLASIVSAQDGDKAGGTQSLFNGKNFEGWTFHIDPRAKDLKPEDVWSIDKGVIICKGKPFGYMITKNEYENYILELEWKWGDKAGNSKSVTTTFTINTASPTVTLNQPPSPSKNTTPSFSGTATSNVLSL